MRASVITVVHGREAHLALQRASLAASTLAADHVVVAMDDPAVWVNQPGTTAWTRQAIPAPIRRRAIAIAPTPWLTHVMPSARG